MSEPKVTVSVVTFNSGNHIEKLLSSLAKNTKGIAFHIYVIDNGSSDNTIQIVSGKEYPFVTLIQSKTNKGFGGGHNTILEQIRSKYHVCLNPDIAVNYDVLSLMADYMEEHPHVGIITPKILNTDGSIQLLPKREPRLIYLIARRINTRFLQKYRTEYEMSNIDSNQKFDIEFCSGCFMFMRTWLFKKVGGFDERFFMYFEDADLTKRIRKFAHAEYNPDFVVYHLWERAGSKKLKYFVIQAVSMCKYLIKWRRSKSAANSQ